MKKQRNGMLNVYAAIIMYKMNHYGLSPSVAELVELTNYHSTKPISDNLHHLERAGLIKRRWFAPRSIRVVGGVWTPPNVDLSALTVRQAAMYKEIVRYARNNDGNTPILSELRQRFGLTSSASPRYHIKVLENAGLLHTVAGKHRSVAVANATYTIDLDRVPELGRATASRALAESMEGSK